MENGRTYHAVSAARIWRGQSGVELWLMIAVFRWKYVDPMKICNVKHLNNLLITIRVLCTKRRGSFSTQVRVEEWLLTLCSFRKSKIEWTWYTTPFCVCLTGSHSLRLSKTPKELSTWELEQVSHAWSLVTGREVTKPIVGIWALDVGDQYPEAQVVGIDLSPIQPKWQVPVWTK
jgi:hypothetical protein